MRWLHVIYSELMRPAAGLRLIVLIAILLGLSAVPTPSILEVPQAGASALDAPKPVRIIFSALDKQGLPICDLKSEEIEL